MGEENFWLDGVNPVVHSVGGVSINNPKGVEGGAKKKLIGGDVEGKNIVRPLKPREHRVSGKKKYMKVDSHAWLPNRWKKGLETIKGRKVSLIDGWILQKDYGRIGGHFSERLKQRKKNIPASKTVILNDGKKRRGRGRPLTLGRQHGLIIHSRDEPEE